MAPVRSTLLAVDDDPGFVRTLTILLQGEGYRVVPAHSGAEALRCLEQEPSVDLVLCDLSMPGLSGMDVLRAVSQQRPQLPLIMMTAHSSIRSAVEAIKEGAFQYLAKPIEPDELLVQVERALEVSRLRRRHRQLRERTGDPDRFDRLVGSSPAMENLRATIRRLAEVDSTVLLRGETGTGKELVARLIHAQGERAEQPFVVVNCTAIPGELLESELFGHDKGAFTGAVSSRAGRVEQAANGTLLLDEIGDMPLQLQPKLLRFLQERRAQRVGGSHERRVDARVIAATHRDLEEAIAAGSFREDLFHRLNTIPLEIPPLRRRRQDTDELTRHLLDKVAARLGRPAPRLHERSLAWLQTLPFPGNVRELENLLERALVLGDPVDGVLCLEPVAAGDTVPGPARELPLENGLLELQERFRREEERLVRRAVLQWPHESNETIAHRLGTQRRVLERRMKDYGITKAG